MLVGTSWCAYEVMTVSEVIVPCRPKQTQANDSQKTVDNPSERRELRCATGSLPLRHERQNERGTPLRALLWLFRKLRRGILLKPIHCTRVACHLNTTIASVRPVEGGRLLRLCPKGSIGQLRHWAAATTPSSVARRRQRIVGGTLLVGGIFGGAFGGELRTEKLLSEDGP